MYRGTAWEGGPQGVKVPYPKYIYASFIAFLSSVGHVKSGVNLGRPLSKAKQCMRSIVDKYREGKVKRTPEGE